MKTTKTAQLWAKHTQQFSDNLRELEKVAKEEFPPGTKVTFPYGEKLLTGQIGFVDEHGKPVKRTKYSHPYNYDGFVLWRGGENTKVNGTVYSDRLLHWDWDKHNALCRKHFGDEGQYWNDRDPAKIEAFLRDWTDCPQLRLILVMEYCDQASGYPCWRFDYYRPDLEAPKNKGE